MDNEDSREKKRFKTDSFLGGGFSEVFQGGIPRCCGFGGDGPAGVAPERGGAPPPALACVRIHASPSVNRRDIPKKIESVCLRCHCACLRLLTLTGNKTRLGRIFQKSIEKPTIFTPEMLESYEHYKKIGAWNAKSSSMHALCAVVCTILMLLLWLAHWADFALLPGMRHVPTVCLFVLLATVAKQWAVCNWRISRANAIGIDFDRRYTCLPAPLHPRHGLLTSGLRPFQHPSGRSLRVHGPSSEA